MEDYEYRVIRSHATQSQNSSKSTSNISKFTSKSTSKTNQIKVRGAMGGLTPSTRASPRLVFPQRGGAHGPGHGVQLDPATTHVDAHTQGARPKGLDWLGYWLDYWLDWLYW